MRALTVHPGQPNSVRLEDAPAPPQSDGAVLVRALALGICGTDREIIAGQYGWAPPGQERLVIGRAAPDGIICLAGVSSGGHKIKFDVGDLNRGIVLENHVVFGSVDANRRHYRAAAEVLAKAHKSWLSRLITRRVPLARWREAFEQRPGDIKVIVDFTGT